MIEKPQNPQQYIIQQQKTQKIFYQIISNDDSLIRSKILLQLKNIFSRQLPKMPIQYITRLVLDKKHQCLVMMKNPNQVIGGLCFRMFQQNSLVQIVFLAVTGEQQIKGYGTRLMYQMKNLMQNRKIKFMMTFADNLALGYFKKQGFQDKLTIPNNIWKGYIKDYEGGTIMQYVIHPKLNYLNLHNQASQFAAFMQEKIIKSTVKKHILGFQQIEIIKKNPHHHIHSDGTTQILPFDPMKIPGLEEAGWTWQQFQKLKKKPVFDILDKCYEMAEQIYGSPQAWPFRQSVSQEFSQYFEVITNPMDLGTVLRKLKTKKYQKASQFVADIKLIFHNAKKFNQPKTPYYKNAQKLQQLFAKKLQNLKLFSI